MTDKSDIIKLAICWGKALKKLILHRWRCNTPKFAGFSSILNHGKLRILISYESRQITKITQNSGAAVYVRSSLTLQNPLFFVHKFDRPRAVFYLLQSRWSKTREPRETREQSPRRKNNNFLVSPQSVSRSLSKNSSDLREKWT